MQTENEQFQRTFSFLCSVYYVAMYVWFILFQISRNAFTLTEIERASERQRFKQLQNIWKLYGFR